MGLTASGWVQAVWRVPVITPNGVGFSVSYLSFLTIPRPLRLGRGKNVTVGKIDHVSMTSCLALCTWRLWQGEIWLPYNHATTILPWVHVLILTVLTIKLKHTTSNKCALCCQTLRENSLHSSVNHRSATAALRSSTLKFVKLNYKQHWQQLALEYEGHGNVLTHWQ